MTRKGRGWHGEPGRHADAARGILTGHVQRPGTKTERLRRYDDRVMERAEEKMERVIKRIVDRLPKTDGMVVLPHTWQFSMHEQERITKMLEEIIFDLKRVELNKWMTDELWTAETDLEDAWAFTREHERNTNIEMARERLHGIIVNYNAFGFPGCPPDD